MDLAKDEFSTAIEDVRTRQAALVSLIYQTDAQAIALLQLYATLGIATTSGAVAGFNSSAYISMPVAISLAVATAIMVIGATLCLKALQANKISLPGRTPDFWCWAAHESVDWSAALQAYLQTADEFYQLNRKLNVRTATALKWAKRCSIVAPLLAGAAGAAAIAIPT